jgi:aspartate/methionine/tyrosine aminotransferase
MPPPSVFPPCENDGRRKWFKEPVTGGKTVSLPVVTCGITHGIATFADIWTNPGDVIILPEMMWGNYNMIFSVRKDARIRHYELFTADGGFNLAPSSRRSARRRPTTAK